MPRRDKAKQNRANREHKARRRNMAITALGGVCARCRAVSDPSKLEFDHIDPADKSERPTDLWGRRWEYVLTVLWKFQILCVDCHAIKTELGNEHALRRVRPFRDANGNVIRYDEDGNRITPYDEAEALPDWVTCEV